MIFLIHVERCFDSRRKMSARGLKNVTYFFVTEIRVCWSVLKEDTTILVFTGDRIISEKKLKNVRNEKKYQSMVESSRF